MQQLCVSQCGVQFPFRFTNFQKARSSLFPLGTSSFRPKVSFESSHYLFGGGFGRVRKILFAASVVAVLFIRKIITMMRGSTSVLVAPLSSRGHNGVCSFIIRLLFRLERAAIESMGDDDSLLLIDRRKDDEASSAREQHGPDMMMVEATQQTPLLPETNQGTHVNQTESALFLPKYLVFSQRRCLRYIANALVFCLFLSVECMYYICLMSVSKVEPSVVSLLRLEFVTLPVLLSFWFAAPMHCALGYFTRNANLSECCRNRDKLLADSGAHFYVKVTLIMILALLTAEGLVWISRQQARSTSQQEEVAFYVYYAWVPFFRFVHGVAFLFPLLLTALAMRGITARLKEIDQELNVELNDSQQTTNYSSSSSHREYGSMLKRWSETYHRLGQDMGILSERFGTRMVGGFALVLVATINIISLVWQNTKTEMNNFDAAMVLIVYSVNASVLMIAIGSVCFPVTACTQNIGPKLVIMAFREQQGLFDVTSTGHTTTRLFQLLSNAFLLAPIEMTVGNLECLPSAANAIAGLLVGFFLVVLGYNTPTT